MNQKIIKSCIFVKKDKMKDKIEKIRKPRKTKERISGNNIRLVLEQKGMIAEELADISKMCPSFISRIINNHIQCVSLPTALRLSKALNTPVEKLFYMKF
jgi:plasmid maintenance system antidote protein VapI